VTSAALAGIAIGITAALASALVLRTRRLIDLERRLQFIEDYYSQEGEEYDAIEQAEMMARVDFATGYDKRLEVFYDYVEGIWNKQV